MKDNTQLQFNLESLEHTQLLGEAIAKSMFNQWQKGVTLYLEGDLGAGKTTLSRYIIRGLGHSGNVKSPTYTLVEPYELEKGRVHHFDLYRLADPEELEFMGVRDYFDENTLSIIEWPEKGASYLAPADLMITLSFDKVRLASIHAFSALGETILDETRQMLVDSN